MPVRCTGCGFPLAPEILEARALRACRYCGSETLAMIFPALFAPPATIAAADMQLAAGEAYCFYHASKRASAPCSQCGRFLCALCSVEFGGEVWCPECLEAGYAKRKVVNLENHRTLYDSIALALATWPMLFFYVSLVTAPVSMFAAIHYWKQPSSLVRRHPKVRRVLAIVLSTAQMAGWVAIFVLLAYSLRMQRHRAG